MRAPHHLDDTQTALDEVRDRLALVVESSRLGTWDWNMATGEVVFNERWAQIIGYTLEELQPVSIQTWADLVHPDDLAASNTMVDTHARGFSDFYEIECRMRHRDGLWVWILTRGRIVEWDAEGRPTRMTGTHQDITDRKEAEQRLAASEASYRALVERMVDVVVALDVQGNITFLSPSFKDLLGWSPEQWTGKPALDLVYDHADRDTAIASFNRMLHNDTSVDRLRLCTKDCEYRWIEATAQAQRAADGSVACVIGVWRDVTAAVEREEAARRESQQLSEIASYMGDVVIHLDRGVVAWVSPSIAKEIGGKPQHWVGITLADHVHPDDRTVLAAARRRLDGGMRDRTRLRLRDLSGGYHWVDVVGSPTGGHPPTSIVLSMRVIDDDIAREGSLRRLAGSDGLTGLANRRELMNRLAIQLCDRKTSTAVIFCDVDNLKTLNDTHGHAIGDAVLIATASRVQSLVRPDDLVARFGGDEFVILLKGVGDLHGAASVADRIRKAVEAPIAVPGGTVSTTLSMGVALAVRAETPGPLLQRADAAMYLAKRAGRNRTVVSPG